MRTRKVSNIKTKGSHISQHEAKMLPFKEHEDYFEALVENDVTTLQAIFSAAHLEERKVLLDGIFQFQSDSSTVKAIEERMTRPLLVTALMGSEDALKFLLSEGADIFQENVFGENIIHSLVAGSSLELTPEKLSLRFYETFIKCIGTRDAQKLLMHENVDGLRPLEMTANLACLLLFKAILLTPQVYVKKSSKRGIFAERWIDVTEYESHEPGNRRYKAPLKMFAHLDKNVALSGSHGDILKCDLFNLWLKQKTNYLFFPCLLMFIPLVTTAPLFLVQVTFPFRRNLNNIPDGSANKSVEQCHKDHLYFSVSHLFGHFVTVFVTISSVMSILILPTLLLRINSKCGSVCQRNLQAKKVLVVFAGFFQMFHIFCCCLYLAVEILFIIDDSRVDSLLNFLIVGATSATAWSFMYVLQFSSFIGYFSIAVQKMIWVLAKFCVLFVIIFVPFAHVFYRLLQDRNGCANASFSPTLGEH